ncbi:alcohol dehydrogenase catalytic domain-containing protein [Marivita hallyeonensis]|uniref:Alcohol dehydrogenase GroES-like domain-containing protein n=1 Tax=Marivita hallyeonensis TaxID=996342 RepID=A0A1M5S4R3_9RHOB|nr:alcohol dehydrogenase catalytic domain-containing protein [Marivita hallyeonensis]SHH33435.1 Alcohol dehydrogenase GroES-like domain-containing protein [Marivita hallyeonensis]
MSFRQVVQTSLGRPENLELKTVASLPEPGPGQVRAHVLATSAAFADVKIRMRLNPGVREKLPFVLGHDLLGLIDATGPRVEGWSLGDRVADRTTIGAYSEYVGLPADRLTRVPDGITDEDGLVMFLPVVTPYQMLHRVAKAKAGQSLLFHGEGGTVGHIDSALGLAPREAVYTFAVSPQNFFELPDQDGTVTVGRWADLFLLDANPRDSLENLLHPRTVIIGGQVLDGSAVAKIQANLIADGR